MSRPDRLGRGGRARPVVEPRRAVGRILLGYLGRVRALGHAGRWQPRGASALGDRPRVPVPLCLVAGLALDRLLGQRRSALPGEPRVGPNDPVRRRPARARAGHRLVARLCVDRLLARSRGQRAVDGELDLRSRRGIGPPGDERLVLRRLARVRPGRPGPLLRERAQHVGRRGLRLRRRGQPRLPSGSYESSDAWAVEGHGVEPDVVVHETPTELAEGRDPQLEAAVRHLLKELGGRQRPARPRPPGQ